MRPPERKNIRLGQYDYSQNGVYFVTICTKDKQNLFWNAAACAERPLGIESPKEKPCLSNAGVFTEQYILRIPAIYPHTRIDKYTVMPNHVHMLVVLNDGAFSAAQGGRPMDAPTVSRIIQHYKGCVTKRVGKPVWQKSFYEHMLRSEKEYQEVWQYIDTNPAKWREDDCFR